MYPHIETIKEAIDDALRAETSVPRHELVVCVNARGFEHIRSYVVYDKYRGATVSLHPEMLEDWLIRRVRG